jgi:hypothetical protein
VGRPGNAVTIFGAVTITDAPSASLKRPSRYPPSKSQISERAPTDLLGSRASVALTMPYMSVVGIDGQECQAAKADKDPKRQTGVPEERVKHHSPPLNPAPHPL